MAARHIVALAQAVPENKYNWRPAPGVRSISEVYMHIVLTNQFLLKQADAPDTTNAPAGSEKKVTSKEQVIDWLNRSFSAVRKSYPKIDASKKVVFFNRPSTAGNVMLRLLVHMNEHLGQSIAYARMEDVTPPWSQ